MVLDLVIGSNYFVSCMRNCHSFVCRARFGLNLWLWSEVATRPVSHEVMLCGNINFFSFDYSSFHTHSYDFFMFFSSSSSLLLPPPLPSISDSCISCQVSFQNIKCAIPGFWDSINSIWDTLQLRLGEPVLFSYFDLKFPIFVVPLFQHLLIAGRSGGQ